MTATELDDIAIIKAVSALIDLNPDASATTKAETAIRAYLAAIGAGGQAVADLTYGQKLIAEAIEHHFGERAEDYDEDADDTTNRDVWEAFDALSHAEEVFNRARAALSGSGAGWRDMESAPKDWADVLLYVPNLNSDWRNVCEGYFDAENVTWQSPMFGEIAPTHWMPLPSAPDRRPA